MTHFLKMNGAGNDFVILDARTTPVTPDAQTIRRICARENPVTKGCDQLVILEPLTANCQLSTVFMRIYNADGSESGACGNATRCVAWLLMREKNVDKVTVGTASGDLVCERAGEHLIRVDMGEPRLTHAEIPVAEGIDLMDVDGGALKHGVAVGMGNPHVVFFVENVSAIDLAKIGPEIEHRTDIFPERVNVSIASFNSPLDGDSIKLRVWERGAGLTQACGTAACATLVAAVQKGLSERTAQISLPGDVLYVEWRADNHVLLTGPVELEFRGEM